MDSIIQEKSSRQIHELSSRANSEDLVLVWNKQMRHKTTTFFKVMKKLREHLFVFLYRADVSTDNNASERAVRPISKMKISGQFKYLQRESAILRSIVDTAIKSIIEIPNCKSDWIVTPTFIFYKDGLEIGRYVERARQNFERDMLRILRVKSYKHVYQN